MQERQWNRGRRRLILLTLVCLGAALAIGAGLPRWRVGVVAAAGEAGSRASGERKARHGPAQKAKDAAKDDAAAQTEDAADSGEQDEAKVESGENGTTSGKNEDGKAMTDPEKLEKLKEKLSDEQMNVCFKKGTEPPFSGKYYHLKDPGEYRCAVCAQPLFESDTKFDSGTGWPSFWDMAFEGAVKEIEDNSHGMKRVEVTCAQCGSHLGHVFPDGPEPSGLRYCINSLSLEFIPAEQVASEKAEAEKAKPGSEVE
jgi:peptide-methionine (R)-S-oxide reductase